MRKRIAFLIVSLWMACTAGAQDMLIKGTVTDSITGEGLLYASLQIKGTSIGTATDDGGNFSFSAPARKSILLVSYLGYDTREIEIAPGHNSNLDIHLPPSSIVLDEVTVKPRRERYSKRDNPAVTLAKKLIGLREENSPYNHDYYRYDRYEKMIFALNEYERKPKKNGKADKFDFLVEFIDTLEAGTTVLPVSEKEIVETVYYRRKPKSEKRVVQGSQSSGVDEILSRDGVRQFLDEVLQEVDIFGNDIPLLLQRFVSPLSSIGSNYYKYYLLDTLNVGGQPCVDLGFVPFNSETFGFTGHLYVALDSTYFIKKVVLNVPRKINLNFISQMTIEQTFERAPDGTRIITTDDISVHFKLTENSKGMYARRLNVYSRHSFNPPDDDHAWVFREGASVITLKEAYRQPTDFWTDHRPDTLVHRNPNTVEKLMEQLRTVKAYNIAEKVVSTLVSGYIPTHKDATKSKFEFGPMNSTFNGNSIEGGRFRLGGGTTPAFSSRLFLDGYVAYGTKDGKFKYDGLVEYSFNERKEFRKEFPVHSLRFEYMYDINKLGQDYMYTSKDNMLLALKRKKDTRATYLRQGELTYTRELYNGLSYGAVLRNFREYATPYAVFDRVEADGTVTSQPRYDMSQLELQFRYGKDEKFYQTRNSRVPITFDALIFNVNHVMARKDFLGSSYDYQRTDIGVRKRFWFSAFGYMDVLAKAGKVWNKVPYPLLILPNVNLTYTIQPESYTNMNVMEFINDEYASWDITYYMNGNLLNRLPLVKKLQWREVFCFRGLWGNLTDKNNPAKNPSGLFVFPAGSYTMGKDPYMEASVGIENIFKFLRIDYVWRINYWDNPDIQKHGVRMTMKLSF